MQTDQTVPTYTLFVGVDIAAQTAMVATQRPGAKVESVFDDRADARRLYQSFTPAPDDWLCARPGPRGHGSNWLVLD